MSDGKHSEIAAPEGKSGTLEDACAAKPRLLNTLQILDASKTRNNLRRVMNVSFRRG